MSPWPVKENGLWILLVAVGLWAATFVILFALARGSAPTLANGPFRKGLQILALLVAILVLGPALFRVNWTEPSHRLGILTVLLGAALASLLDRRNRFTLGITLSLWYLALTLLTLEGVTGTFLIERHVPIDEEGFNQKISRRWPYEVDLVKKPGVYRILALGDSFGIVHEENNYHYLVHSRFQEEGVSAEIVNFSIPAIEPVDELKLLRKFGTEYQPDLVLQNFFVGNDFDVPPGEFVILGGLYIRSHEGWAGFYPGNFILVNWVKSQWKVLSEHAKREKELESAEPVGMFSREEFLNIEVNRLTLTCRRGPPNQRYLQGAVPILDDIRQITLDLGAKYALVAIPDQFQVDSALFEEILAKYNLRREDFDLGLPQQFLKRYCEERGIPFLDILEAFQKDGRGGDLFLLRDTHFNLEGNAIVAEEVHRFLRLTMESQPPHDASP